MTYSVKEIFFTLQGEGIQTGRAAVFCRFAGCNLWSGREAHRSRALCQFCDTDFVGTDGPGGGKFESPDQLAAAVEHCWLGTAEEDEARFVVCTGGEPLLQLDSTLIGALHGRGFAIAIETNGTIEAPPGIDWICVSPKAATHLAQTRGNELKLVFPQPRASPEHYVDLEFDHFLLQPMDGPARERNTTLAVAYCQRHPRWRLSTQSHKWLDIP